MPDFALRRHALDGLFESSSNPNPGLWLSRGLKQWSHRDTKKGEEFQAHVRKSALIPVDEVYTHAYRRWEALAASSTISTWIGRLEGRLFIGSGGPSVIETSITLSRTYGVPIIPGSAQKGLVRAYAEATDLDPGAADILFGKVGATPEGSDAGYIIFHDAWWIPDSASTPLAQEIITVHHPDYYRKAGNHDATDFDSPVLNVQVAARGAFLFAVESASQPWSDLARGLLARGLTNWGIGGKTAAGYGRFKKDKALQDKFDDTRRKVAIEALPFSERMRAEIESMTPADLAQKLGRERNKTREVWGAEWAKRIELVRQIHGDLLRTWENSQKSNEKKAFKTIYGAGSENA